MNHFYTTYFFEVLAFLCAKPSLKIDFFKISSHATIKAMLASFSIPLRKKILSACLFLLPFVMVIAQETSPDRLKMTSKSGLTESPDANNDGFNLPGDNQPDVLNFNQFREDELHGRGYLKINKVGEKESKVVYHFNRTKHNPFSVTHEYRIRRADENGFFIDMTSVLEDEDIYLEKNTTAISYQGDDLFFPADLKSGRRLPPVQGVFFVTKDGLPNFNLTYELSLSERSVIDSKEIQIGKYTINTTQLTYSYQLIKKINDTIISVSNQQVTDWITPDFGVVGRERRGSMLINGNEIPVNLNMILTPQR